MKLSDPTNLKLKKLLFIALISAMIGALYTRLIRPIKPIYLFQGIFVGVGVSLSLGASVLFFLAPWLKRRSFTTAIILSTTYYLLAIISILTVAPYCFGKKIFAIDRNSGVLSVP